MNSADEQCWAMIGCEQEARVIQSATTRQGGGGLVDTAIKTSRSGYLQRCLVKNLECLKVCYDYTVRDADGSIVQFYYGEDGVDVLKSSCLTEFKILAANQEILLERLRNGHSLGSDLLESNGYISCLPELLQLKAENFIRGVSEDQKRKLKLRKPKEFMNLVKLKYATSLAHAGEAVGVIAAQSIGEPSTQMTLNTFHLAGRGEGNVTLGMPRLREILMTASKNILTPLMICPLSDAECVAAKLKRIRFSDIIESMDVSVVPCFIGKRVVSTVYKLKLNLCGPDMHPPHANITNDECEDAFENKFVPLLKKAVDKYLDKMSKSGEGIEIVSEHPEGNVMEKAPDENEPENESIKGEGTELDEDEGEDEGADAQKRKKQSEDDIEYDDEIENELSAIEDVNSEDDEMVDSGKEGDEVEDGLGTCVDGDGSEILEEALNDVSKNLPVAKSFSGSKVAESSSMRPRMDKLKSKTAKSLKHLESKGKTKTKTDARIIVSAGSCLEVHFFIMKGTYLLLSQFAEKIAMNVFIRTVEGIDDCSLIIPKGFGNKTNSQLNPGRKLKKQLKNMPEDLHENTEPIKLQTRGVNFSSLWRMQDELDIRKLCSNDINAMLEKYGVEAARETIVAEIRAVFERYGIRPDIRHLSLIADFMTFDGQYRPMNRFGISSSVSPFLKITFETATNFIVQMASHGEVEPLESPSARIAMGQPVKLGTGCFDLLQKLELD
ncbi:DNA-directed RNA polymerase I subunit 1 [Nymphaea thermarum]|nr:DNA-directed RNA polymerase I subunit 1 [Nymphaea thermarum]